MDGLNGINGTNGTSGTNGTHVMNSMNGASDQSTVYDVVIMGAGFAGVCQARHLLLNIPTIKIAMIDPRSEERGDKDLKIGESMVEIASLFVCKDLGLQDYIIENHTPKFGLNFHWPKDPAKTDELDDYLHVWANRQPPVATFHINRAKFESDVHQMNKDMGITFFQGSVLDVDLTPGDALNMVHAKTSSQEPLELKCKHVIDAAGRKFIIGKKKDHLLFGPENLHGIDNASVWMRVRNVNPKILHEGYAPNGPVSVSRYYATNHWFGHGHWLWMIPTDKKNHELSIGIVYHKNVIETEQLNKPEKFMDFMKENHNLLYQIAESGEAVDFFSWSRIAHRSKQMFSEDNWYVIGDAAYIIDAFYSYGTSTIALACDGVTEIIKAKMDGDADANEKCAMHNEFNLAYAEGVNMLMRDHDKQLGHASVMSWRIYFEYMWWFGVHVPMYLGKWNRHPLFGSKFPKIMTNNFKGLFTHVYDLMNQLVEENKSIGLMDAYRADQLIGHFTTLQHFDDDLENAKLAPWRNNIFGGMKKTYAYVAVWYAKFLWKGFGAASLFQPKNLYYFGYLGKLIVNAMISEMVFKRKTRGLPNNAGVAEMRKEFESYQYSNELQPWEYDLGNWQSHRGKASKQEESAAEDLEVGSTALEDTGDSATQPVPVGA